MAAPHYTATGNPVQGSQGSSKELRDEFNLIEAGIQVLNLYPVVLVLEDANTASSIYAVVPWACKLVQLYAVPSVANTTTETILTAKIATVAVTGGQMTIGATDPIGTVQAATPTALNALIAGQGLEIDSDGGGDSVMPVLVTAIFERT